MNFQDDAAPKSAAKAAAKAPMKASARVEPVAADLLRWTFDPADLPRAVPAEPSSARRLPGQERAREALEFGLAIRDDGYNLFVAGPPGIGKTTAVRAFLAEVAADRPTPSDWCYVYNFEDPYRPRALRAPAGEGRRLQGDMERFLEHLRRDVPKAFDSDEYRKKRDEIVSALARRRARVMSDIEAKAEKAGYALEVSPFGMVLAPRRPEGEGKADAAEPTPQEQERLLERRKAFEAEIKDDLASLRELETDARLKLKDLDRDVAASVFGTFFQELFERYRAVPDVVRYLEAVREDILDNVDHFKHAGGDGEDGTAGLAALFRQMPSMTKYAVNVVVDNGGQTGAPVVVEWSPLLGELFGRCEKESRFGALYTDFSLIKGGALHRANGGYLVLPVEELLRSPFSWDALKRALRTREIRIEDMEEKLGWLAIRGLRPEPIPLDVKVVLIGRSYLHRLLHAYDEDFAKLFRVKAEFDTRVERDAGSVRDTVAFLRGLAAREGLPPLEPAAQARLLEHSARLAESRRHLSTDFGALAEAEREAAHWAKTAGAPAVGAEHVSKALAEKVRRSNLVESHVRDMIRDGTLMLDLSGRRVGRVNGLSVVSLGDHAFGKPSRITASVGPGREGLVDIEREVELSGPIHSKGVMILHGYLVHRFAQTRPLSLSARLVFEQSYEGLEGDSASSAELYALLSALSGVPLRQGIAVTGSVNQHGALQPIGGVNEKIEGFFDACRARRLDGAQGVLIPAANLDGLMLREDVVDAARRGKFHVWTARTVDEGLEVLTGVAAGRRTGRGRFPEGSVNALVERALARYAESMKQEESRPPTPISVSLTTASRLKDGAVAPRRRGGGRRG